MVDNGFWHSFQQTECWLYDGVMLKGVPLRWTKPPWISGHRSRSRFLRLTKLSKLLIPAAVMRLLLQRLRVVRFDNPGAWAQKPKSGVMEPSNAGHQLMQKECEEDLPDNARRPSSEMFSQEFKTRDWRLVHVSSKANPSSETAELDISNARSDSPCELIISSQESSNPG